MGRFFWPNQSMNFFNLAKQIYMQQRFNVKTASTNKPYH